jgi:hypothetical protein
MRVHGHSAAHTKRAACHAWCLPYARMHHAMAAVACSAYRRLQLRRTRKPVHGGACHATLGRHARCTRPPPAARSPQILDNTCYPEAPKCVTWKGWKGHGSSTTCVPPASTHRSRRQQPAAARTSLAARPSHSRLTHAPTRSSPAPCARPNGRHSAVPDAPERPEAGVTKVDSPASPAARVRAALAALSATPPTAAAVKGKKVAPKVRPTILEYHAAYVSGESPWCPALRTCGCRRPGWGLALAGGSAGPEGVHTCD